MYHQWISGDREVFPVVVSIKLVKNHRIQILKTSRGLPNQAKKQHHRYEFFISTNDSMPSMLETTYHILHMHRILNVFGQRNIYHGIFEVKYFSFLKTIRISLMIAYITYLMTIVSNTQTARGQGHFRLMFFESKLLKVILECVKCAHFVTLSLFSLHGIDLSKKLFG